MAPPYARDCACATAGVCVLLSEIDVTTELRPTRVSVGTVTYPPGGTLGPRTQLDLQLVLVHAGSARVWVDEAPRLLAAGQVGLLLPGHRERFAFDPHVGGALATPPRPPPAVPSLLAHLAGAALWRYIGEAERQPPERARPIDDAQRFIHANFVDPTLTLGDIAGAAHVTPAHLIRGFRAELGTTPKAYLWQRRVALGIDLLANTGLPITSIAERCGFRTAHHFSRRIKQATGLPPAALRRTRWEAAEPG